MHAAFEGATRGRTLVPEWREEDGGVHPALDSMLRHARAADRIIASQTDPSWRGTYDLDLADRLAFEAGRPVPYHSQCPGQARQAWRESTCRDGMRAEKQHALYSTRHGGNEKS